MALDFSGKNLRGKNFKGQDLAEANFRDADIRGANFSHAYLARANFQNAKAGIQQTLKVAILVSVLLVSVLSGLALATAVDAILQLGPVPVNVLVISWFGISVVAILCTMAVALATAEAGMIQGNASIAAIALAALIGSRFTPASLMVVLGTYIGWQAIRNNPKYSFIQKIVVLLTSARGTSFYNADLTDADFTRATLKNTDLRGANITRTDWSNSQGLNQARVGKSYLRYPVVQNLVTSGRGGDKSFDGLNLEGINLRGASLSSANLTGANLNQANLQYTDLSRAILKQSRLDGADLTGANLTGAYIEDWGITGETKLDDVHCDYVYMRVPTRDNPNPLRKPDNFQSNFAPGDFTAFFKPLIDTLDLYHNQTIDPRAIAVSLKQLYENYPEAELEIVAIEKRGQDNLLIRAKTTETADKARMSEEYFKRYQQLQLLLAEKDSRIQSLEEMIMTALQKPSFSIEHVQTMGDLNVRGEGSDGNFGIENVGTAGNVNIQGGNSSIGNIAGDTSISIEGNIENIENIESVGDIEEISRNIEVKVTRGKGMLIGEDSNLVLQVTNLSSNPINGAVSIEIQDSAEYEILSGNPAFLSTLDPHQSVEISFCLRVNVQREIPINYKVNGRMSATAIYINAVHDNPYVYGNPVGSELNFVGRQKELEQIIQAVSKPAKQDILIVGERRTGKTSLLNQLRNRLDKPLIPVYVVLNTSERPTAESVLGLIFHKILEELLNQGLIEKSEYHNHNFPDLKFADNVKIVIEQAKSRLANLRIVLMLDEADSLLEVRDEKRNSVDERPQNILRSVLQSSEVGNELSAILAATTELAAYMSKRSSPLFNHFRKVPLKPLSLAETEKLIREPAKTLEYAYSDSAVQRIVSLSGGQPYYCQALCYEAFSQAIETDRTMIDIEDVSIAEEKVVYDLYVGYLTGFWQRLNREERYFLRTLITEKFINLENIAKVKRLLDWQIINATQSTYSFSGGLVQKWTVMALDEDDPVENH